MFEITFFTLFIIVLNVSNVITSNCNLFDPSAKHVFVTKTNYNSSLDYFNSNSLLNLDFVPKTCKLDKLFVLSRHSTRNPGLDKYELFLDLYPKLKDSIYKKLTKNKERTECENYLFDQLSKWNFRYKREEINLIVPIGYQITTEIGSRYGKKFGELFNNSITEAGVSKEKRTVQTMEAFLKGFENPSMNLSVQQKLSLHFHNLDFKSTKNKDDETEDELIKKYTKSDQIKKIRESVSKRLGLKERLKLKELKGLYQMCAFDYMLYNDTFWCNFFTDKELNKIEFLYDASMFRKLHVNSEKQLNNSAIFFRELKEFLHNSKEKVFLGFSHSEVLKIILTRFGLFENEIYLTDDFKDAYKKSSNREWRASRIMPFNSNFAFVKYNCENPINGKMIPRLATFYQEQPIKIVNCDNDNQSQNGLLCPLSIFLRFIYPFHKDFKQN